LRRRLAFIKVPTIIPWGEGGELLITFEDVGNGIPKLKYELVLQVGGVVKVHSAIVKSGSTTTSCNGVQCTYTLVMKEAVKTITDKLTAQVKATNPTLAVTSGKSTDFDLIEVIFGIVYDGCDCLDVKDKASGIYNFPCLGITYLGKELKHSTYCMNDYTEAKGWTLVGRIDASSGEHMKREGKGGLTFPGKQRECGGGLRTTSGPRDVQPPDLCGPTWKLPDAVINMLATYKGRQNSAFKLDCAGRTGFWQFKELQGGTQVKEGFNANEENNHERYRRSLTAGSWSGFILGSESYGYHYAGMCDDKWEEDIGWMAYGFDPDGDAGTHKDNYGISKGCLAHTSFGSRPSKGQWTQKDGYLWLTWN
jgi:hypothetical protein